MTHRRTDQRRRRVIMDEVQQSELGRAIGDPAEPAVTQRKRKPKSAAPRDYSPLASRRHQLKTTDFIPKRWSAWLLLVVALALAGVLLNLAAVGMTPAAPSEGDVSLVQLDGIPANDSEARLAALTESQTASLLREVFSLNSHHGLAAWYSSFLLILASLASLQIYALRQHRRNDYRGTYRIWLWFAVILLVASIHCVVDLPAAAKQLSRVWLMTPDTERASWIVTLVQSALLTAIVVRGLIEVRGSPASCALVCFVWMAYSAAIALQLPVVANFVVSDEQRELAQGNLWILGATLALLVTLYYARFVFLQAAGLIAVPSKSAPAGKVGKSRKTLRSGSAKKSRRQVPAGDEQTTGRAREDGAREPEKPHQAATRQSPLGGFMNRPQTAAAAPANPSSNFNKEPPAQRDEPRPATATNLGDLATREPRLSKAERKRLKRERRRAA